MIGICHKKVGPGEIAIIYGLGKKLKISHGPTGFFLFPLLESYRTLSKETFAARFEITGLLIKKAIMVELSGTARVRLKDDEESVTRAAKHMLSKNYREKVSVVVAIVDEAARGALKNMHPDRLIEDREWCAEMIKTDALKSLDDIGYELQSIAISDVKDKLGYIAALTNRVMAEDKARLAIEEAYIIREGKTISTLIRRDAQLKRIGMSIEGEREREKNLDMGKVVANTEDYFRGIKERLDKGVKGISQNLYKPDKPDDSPPPPEKG
jgi:flotillin